MSDVIEKMFSQNEAWRKRRKAKEKDYFANLAKGQSPSIFWIGCCDSRVIPSEIFQTSLGDIFIQTNIANQICPNDPNAMSSFEYAVGVLKVEHIIVCGHTCCGGIMAGMCDTLKDIPENVKKWIAPIHELYQSKKGELPLGNEMTRGNAMSAINVRHQIDKITKLDLMQKLQKEGKAPQVHGQLFHLDSGAISKV